MKTMPEEFTREELLDLGLTEAEIKEYEAGQLYKDMLLTFTGRKAAPDDLQKKIERLWNEKQGT